jgi:hypothetical protein
MVFMSVILEIIKYINQPQRYSKIKAFASLNYKWHLFLIAIITAINYTFFIFGLWLNIPFKDYIPLPDNWYVYLFIIWVAIITQITIDSPEIVDDGSFNPPPAYMLPDKYRIMLTYVSLVINIIIMIQTYVYFGIADLSKKTIISRYVLERFGGWYEGNKLDYLYECAGLFDIITAIYILYLQTTFQACEYGLPPSWNF